MGGGDTQRRDDGRELRTHRPSTAIASNFAASGAAKKHAGAKKGLPCSEDGDWQQGADEKGQRRLQGRRQREGQTWAMEESSIRRTITLCVLRPASTSTSRERERERLLGYCPESNSPHLTYMPMRHAMASGARHWKACDGLGRKAPQVLASSSPGPLSLLSSWPSSPGGRERGSRVISGVARSRCDWCCPPTAGP